ncbi:MAG: class I SAM-dependent methyltransferase [Anaerolineales bacterium]
MNNRPNLVRKRFDRRAKRYDNPLTAFIGEQELRQIRPLIPAGLPILDYGCGSGRVTLELVRLGHAVTAYDFSPQMMELAKRKIAELPAEMRARVEFVESIEQLNGRRWPCITCVGVLDYYPDPRPLLGFLATLLPSKGRLIITFPNAFSPLGWLYAITSRLTVPATPRTYAFAQGVARECGFSIAAVHYAFPAHPVLGHTIVLALEKRSA